MAKYLSNILIEDVCTKESNIQECKKPIILECKLIYLPFKKVLHKLTYYKSTTIVINNFQDKEISICQAFSLWPVYNWFKRFSTGLLLQ